MIELEPLGLAASRVRSQRDACRAIGRALYASSERRNEVDREIALIAAGTNLRRAAANSLLLGEIDSGRGLFDEAAKAYFMAGAAYSAFLDILALERRDHQLSAEPSSAVDIWRLWGLAVIPPSGIRYPSDQVLSLRHQLEVFRAQAVGLLGLPAGAYLDLFDAAVLSSPNARQAGIREALLPILGAYSGAIKRCRSDGYHWSRLAVPFHPAEPDVIGVLIAIDPWLRSYQLELSRAIVEMPIGSDALTLIREILVQYGIWDTPH